MFFDKKINKRKDTSSPSSETIDYYSKGVSQFNAGNYTQAMEFLQAVIDSQPAKESAYLKLAETYVKLGKEEQSRKTLFALLAINPNHKEALSKIQSLLTPKTKQSNVSSETEEITASKSSDSGNGQSPQQKIPNATIPQPSAFHPSISDDSIISVLSPSQNTTPYWMSEQQSGNRIYYKIEQDYCVVVPPEKYGWTGFIKPHGTLFIPDSVKIDGLDFDVKKIDDFAFSRCVGITEIIIPETIEKIGAYSFTGNQIKEIFLPDNIIDIGGGAFSDCHLLSHVKLPNAIKTIKYNTFESTGITFIDIPENVTEIGRSAFQGWLTKVERIRVHRMPFAIEHAFGLCNFDRISAEVPAAYLSAYQNARYWQTMNLIPY